MIRLKGIIKKGKLVLSEPLMLDEGAEVDIIAYIERKGGESLDKKSTTIEIEKEDTGEFIEETMIDNKRVQKKVGNFRKIDKEDSLFFENDDITNDDDLNYDGNISYDDNIQSKIRKLLNKVELSSLISFMQGEHPQLLAIVVEMLDKEKSKTFIENLSPELQGELVYRIAKQQKVSSSVLNQIFNVINRKLSQTTKEIGNPSGGIDSAIDILNNVSRATEINVINYIDKINKELSEEIKRKLFVFEDIIILNDEYIREVITKIDINKLAIALKGVSETLKEKIFNNIDTENRKKQLSEQIKKLGPVRIKDVEKAQQDIIELIKRLEEDGHIVIVPRDIIE